MVYFRRNFNIIMSNLFKKILYTTIFLAFSFVYSQNGVDNQGRKHGPWQVNIQNVKVFEGTYNHGLREGVFKTYYAETGNIENWNNFKNNKFHGIQKVFSENTILLWKANYVNGIKTGIETKYYTNGNKKAELTYNSLGELVGNIKVFDESGNKLDMEITAKESKRTQ